MRASLLSALILAACHSAQVPAPDDSGPGPEDTAPELDAWLEAAPAFDPILGGPLAIRTVAQGSPETVLEVLDAEGALVAAVTDTWDGRDQAGAWAPAGLYTLHLTASVGAVSIEREKAVRVVRCGVLAAWAEGDLGHSARFVPLWWHGSRTLQGPELAFTQADALEDAHGLPVQLPAPGDELLALVEGAALPVGFTWDSRPLLTLALGDATVLGSSGLPGAGVRLEVEGWQALSGAEALEPAVPVLLQAQDPLGTGPGVLDEVLRLRFLVDDEEGTAWEIGVQELPVRWYLLLDEPALEGPEPWNTAWVAAIDPALRALDGTAPTAEAALDGLVRWIFEDLGLSYDTRYGASYYTVYEQGWGPAVFDLSSFLRQGAGRVVNCSDCASILTAWAMMLGAPLDYAIVLENFDLNYILAIGGDTFTHCPFGGWGCSFSYHAVTTNDAGATIWDATLALDGDEDPGAQPCERLLVQAVAGQEYLERLVMRGRAAYGYFGQTRIQ